MTKSLYNLKTTPENTYCITKFDSDLEVESSYDVSLEDCTCPQGERDKRCRHQKMLPMFLILDRVDCGYFLDFDTKTWHRPLAASYEVEYHDLEVRNREAALELDPDQSLEEPQGLEVISINSRPPKGRDPREQAAVGRATGTTDGSTPPIPRKADTNLPPPTPVSVLAPTARQVPASAVGAPPTVVRRRIST